MRHLFFTVVVLLMGGMSALMAGCQEMAMKDTSYLQLENRLLSPSVGAAAARTDAPAVATSPRQSAQGGDGEVVTLSAVAETQPARLIIYQGSLTVVVADVARSLQSLRHEVDLMNGYMQELDRTSITIRVPADLFEQAVAVAEHLGEVTDRNIKAQDITEQMRDLKIRLDNAEQVRLRLKELVAKSEKMKDTLDIEKELERVTETIELLKGKIQFLGQQAAFSTLKVTFNSPLPQQRMVAVIPFGWVRNLGDGLVAAAAEADPDTSRWHARNVRFDLPKAYIRYYEREYLTEAMSAEGMLIKLQRQDNYDGGNLDFWSALARKALVENRSILLEKPSDVELGTHAKARILSGTREMAGKPHGYMLALVVTKRYVYSVEAWGPKEQFRLDKTELENAVRSLDVNP